jgi:hypothetical protein
VLRRERPLAPVRPMLGVNAICGVVIGVCMRHLHETRHSAYGPIANYDPSYYSSVLTASKQQWPRFTCFPDPSPKLSASRVNTWRFCLASTVTLQACDTALYVLLTDLGLGRSPPAGTQHRNSKRLYITV